MRAIFAGRARSYGWHRRRCVFGRDFCDAL